MKTLRQFRNRLVRFLEWVLIAAMSLLTLDVLWGIFSRYVLGAQSRWTEELAIYLLIWVALLGASVTYGDKGHLGVDYFVGKMDPSARRAADIAVEVLVAFFTIFVLLYGGGVLVDETLAASQVSPALGWSIGYVYLAVPISGFFFLMFCLENLIELILGSPAGKPAYSPTDL